MLQQAFLDNIKELYDQGLTNAEIGRKVNKKPASVNFYLNKLGLKNKIATKWTTSNIYKDNELQEKIQQLVKQNKTQSEVLRELGINAKSLRKYFKKTNIVPLNKYQYDVSISFEKFLNSLNENNKQFEYIDGYTNNKSKVTLRCKKCGNTIERYPSNVRQGKKITCSNCTRIKRDKLKQEKKNIQEQKKKQKELNKVLDSIQLSFLVCKHCGSLYIPIRNNQKYCSKRCSIRNHEQQKSRARLEKAKANGNIDYSITLDKLINRDNNNCYICNTQCNLNDFTMINNTKVAGNYYPSIDHVVPIANGGTHTWDNVRLAHRICNTLKSNKNIFCS